MSNKMRCRIFRYRPETDDKPHYETYEIEYREEMSVLDGLNEIRDTQCPDLSYRSSCRMAVCGSCAMMIDGVARLACMLTLAAGTAICVFLAFYLPEGQGNAAAVAVPMALVLSLFFGRLIHWYFRPDSYTGFLKAVTDYTSGGYALPGCFAACGLTAGILRLLRLEREPLRLLDAMSLGGCAGIAVGRLACFFSPADRGQLLQNLRTLPFAYPVSNVVTGAPEYRLATFVIQAMATALIFGGLAAFTLSARRRRGDTALLFLLLYGLSQAVKASKRDFGNFTIKRENAVN